jgi:superfamily II DNA or RNA helicase
VQGRMIRTDFRTDYARFLETKLVHAVPTGLASVPKLSDDLFPFQRDMVTWALKRGRAAIFADTGLGKTRMQIEWARVVSETAGVRVLILAPLAVAQQTAREGEKIGVKVTVSRDKFDATDSPITITNYDRIHRYDASDYGAVVLDESSIIKHHSAKTFHALSEMFRGTQYKLCATATPSPNDYTELGTHAEFLGLCTRAEMLAEFFCHDGGDTSVWRLKGHARAAFWKWVASWGALLRRPSDLGYEDEGYALPGLTVRHHTIASDEKIARESGFLFVQEATDLMSRRKARRDSLSDRVSLCAEHVRALGDAQAVVWCDLNDESDELRKAIPGSVEIRGNVDIDEKERRLRDFSEGRTRVLVTKASVTGWGLNWQQCNRTFFVGATDSWEAYYQAIRRFYRFGQRKIVEVDIYASDVEGSVVKNLLRKEALAKSMSEELSRETREMVLAEVRGQVRSTNVYSPGEIVVPGWIKTEVA